MGFFNTFVGIAGIFSLLKDIWQKRRGNMILVLIIVISVVVSTLVYDWTKEDDKKKPTGIFIDNSISSQTINNYPGTLSSETKQEIEADISESNQNISQARSELTRQPLSGIPVFEREGLTTIAIINDRYDASLSNSIGKIIAPLLDSQTLVHGRTIDTICLNSIIDGDVSCLDNFGFIKSVKYAVVVKYTEQYSNDPQFHKRLRLDCRISGSIIDLQKFSIIETFNFRVKDGGSTKDIISARAEATFLDSLRNKFHNL